jgi:hypothetical protein
LEWWVDRRKYDCATCAAEKDTIYNSNNDTVVAGFKCATSIFPAWLVGRHVLPGKKTHEDLRKKIMLLSVCSPFASSIIHIINSALGQAPVII